LLRQKLAGETVVPDTMGATKYKYLFFSSLLRPQVDEKGILCDEGVMEFYFYLFFNNKHTYCPVFCSKKAPFFSKK